MGMPFESYMCCFSAEDGRRGRPRAWSDADAPVFISIFAPPGIHEGFALVADAGWGEDQDEDRGGVGVDPRAGASAMTVLSAEAAYVRLEWHAHQAVG